jgi:hypothetical protein
MNIPFKYQARIQSDIEHAIVELKKMDISELGFCATIAGTLNSPQFLGTQWALTLFLQTMFIYIYSL